jgi:hypothetical protein
MKTAQKLAYLLLITAFPAVSADLGGIVLGGRAATQDLQKLGISAGSGSAEPGVYHGTKRFDTVDTKTQVEIDAAGKISQISAEFYTLEAKSMLGLANKKWGKPIDSGTAAIDGWIITIWIWQTKDGAEITLTDLDPTIAAGTMKRGKLVMISKSAADVKRGPRGEPL